MRRRLAALCLLLTAGCGHGVSAWWDAHPVDHGNVGETPECFAMERNDRTSDWGNLVSHNRTAQLGLYCRKEGR